MSSAVVTSVTCLHYLDVTLRPEIAPEPAVQRLPDDPFPAEAARQPGVPEEEVQARIAAACLAERQATEQRLQQDHVRQQAALQAGICDALQHFQEERSVYFARVESEVVHLALAIARKILQREAELDPLLLAGLVRIALDGMQSGPAVRLRVPPSKVAAWQQHTFGTGPRQRTEILPDASLAPEECVLETDIGSARLSYEIQLKEIERGFLDLLGQRPDREQSERFSTRPSKAETPLP